MQIIIDENNIICAVATIGGYGNDGIEVDPEKMPADLSTYGKYCYNPETRECYRNPDYIQPVPRPSASERVAVLEALALEREYREAAQVLEREAAQALECETAQGLECETTQALECETTQALERETAQALERTPLQDQKREASASPGEGKGLLKRLFRGKARGERNGQR